MPLKTVSRLWETRKNGPSFKNEIADDINYYYKKYIVRVYEVFHLSSYPIS